MKKLLCLILIHYIFSIFDVYADTCLSLEKVDS